MKNIQKMLPQSSHFNSTVIAPVIKQTESKLVPNPVRLKRKINNNSEFKYFFFFY